MNNEYKIAIVFMILGWVIAQVSGTFDYRMGWEAHSNLVNITCSQQMPFLLEGLP